MTHRQRIAEALELTDLIRTIDLTVEQRTASYCAGCPHRGTSSVILELRRRFEDEEYMRRVHARSPVSVIAHGGIGCYSLNFLPPFRDMHNMAAMGLGGAAGLGAYPFTTNKHYVLCGDSTFFHSEMSTLSNAIKDRQDILYIILDNKNTAMTGHQGTPASAYDVMGNKTIDQDIESVVRGLDPTGQVFLRRVNPVDRDSYLPLLERAFLMDGVRVIIADRECGITFHKKRRAEEQTRIVAEGFLREERHINITPEVCENCRECTINTGCPGLTLVDTPYGEKVGIDQSICVDDQYCTKIKACPSFEQVIIQRSRPPVPPTGNWDLWVRDLPDPHPTLLTEESAPRIHSVFISGVGGMGLGFVAKVLTEAGARQGYVVQYYHQKGLAQRNGAVVSHVLFSRGDVLLSQRIPNGRADLILGLDYLETVRGLIHAHPTRTAVVCNTAITPTIKMLMGEDRFPMDLDGRIRAASREDGFHAADYFALSERFFGSRLYANIMMLGTAWQKGLLPLTAESIESSLIENVKKDARENNLRAFRIGRRLAVDPEVGRDAGTEESIDTLYARRRVLLGESSARAAALESARESLRTQFSELDAIDSRELLRRFADLLEYDSVALAHGYLERIERVYRWERAHAPERADLTRAAMHALYKVLAIKDEVWVAHLLTSEKKLAADRKRYGIDPSRGDRISYVHFNRPHFRILGWDVEWNMKTRNWMLLGMKRLRILRRLLPGWHAKEKAFRDWYRDEVLPFVLSSNTISSDLALRILSLPLSCTGYREVVWPKLEAAQLEFARLRSTIESHD